MVLHPEVQQKAFEEIRSVCGHDRLPSYEADREDLPYFSATLMENFRWAPPAPLGTSAPLAVQTC
jgi:cytochrome P450